MLLLAVSLLAVFHVLLLGLLGESHNLGVHPVVVLDVESEVSGGGLNGVVKHVSSDTSINSGALGLLSNGVLVIVILRDLPAHVVGVHPAEFEDHADDHLEHLSVHPGHDVDLAHDSEHGEKLGDGEDGPDAKVRVVGEHAEVLPGVGAEDIAVIVVVILVPDEELEHSVDSAAHGDVKVGEVAHHWVVAHHLHHVLVVVDLAVVAIAALIVTTISRSNGGRLGWLAGRIVGHKVAEVAHLLVVLFN